MDRLQELRREIDAIDRQLVALFEQRMNTVIHVAEYKLENKMPVLNSGREQQVLEKCVSFLNDKNYAEATTEWMKTTMALSRAAQTAFIERSKSE